MAGRLAGAIKALAREALEVFKDDPLFRELRHARAGRRTGGVDRVGADEVAGPAALVDVVAEEEVEVEVGYRRDQLLDRAHGRRDHTG